MEKKGQTLEGLLKQVYIELEKEEKEEEKRVEMLKKAESDAFLRFYCAAMAAESKSPKPEDTALKFYEFLKREE